MNFTLRLHTERRLDGFTSVDGTVKFYGFVRAAIMASEAKHVLDFGAGRGAFYFDDNSRYRRHLRDLRTTGATVTACDVDPVVRIHPCSDQQVLIDQDLPLPFADEAFDVVVSDMCFEHIQNPEAFGRELIRIIKSGGYICARTPNLFSYVKLFASLIPNKLHGHVLRYIQPSRREVDVFPTHYRLNRIRDVRRAFPNCDIFYYRDNPEPSYYFGSHLIYSILTIVHRHLPQLFSLSLCLFIRKA